jgi:armadillo repeat-containing protein 8
MAADVIAQLANADTARERLAGLRILKNDVVGHAQKKEQWVQAGVLRPLVAILTDDLGDDGDGPKTKLQALQLLAAFASAGSPFLPPIHAAGALPAILSCLQDPRPQIVLTALRVLRDVTEASASAPSFSPLDPTVLADILFTSTYLESLATILAQPDTTRDVAAQISIVARLITKLCRQEKHQYMLVNYGVLDGLATRLASFAVAEGQVVPRAEVTARIEGLSEFIPSPANPSILLSDVLGAIAAIVTDSAFRACRLLYSPSILAVFPNTDSEWGGFPVRTEPLELAGLRPTKQRDHEPMDFLLPYMPAQLRNQPARSSALSSLGTNGRASTSRPHASLAASATDEAFGSAEEERVESPLVPWLISLVRNRDDKDALMAASVLTSLYKCGFAYKSRESILGLLVIPKLLQLLEHAQPQNQEDLIEADLDIIEQTPAVLDRLVTDSESLQKAASDSNAVKTLCKLLKSTYDMSLPSTTPQFWSPGGGEEQVPLNLTADCRLGETGSPPLLAHHIRLRESTLKALGSLASFKEDYRKAIVDQDVVPYIVESLSATPGRPRRPGTNGDGQGEAPVEGSGSNPKAVMISACYAVRMLSRSVNILRTSLIDHAVAIPIYTLLRNRDLDVQIAATAAICNLVTDFSPMRETLARTSILGVLCGHAKSTSPALRLNALWALKHFVNSATTNLKKACLEELQPGWLVQLICDDQEDEALFSARSGDDRQSSVDDLDEEMEMDDPSRMSSFQPPNACVPTSSHIVRLAEARLAALREAELNPVRKARQDDLAIQEQGLGFIRNLIGSSHSSTTSADSTNDTADMIDFLFSTLGQDRFFNILETKLRVKVLRPFSGRRGATGSETSRVLYPQAKIIEAVVYILVHMAASIPRHRQLVITQTELLRLLAGLFNSNEREVRVALCHLVNNLTWQDDANDAPACSQRAVALKKLGFLTKLESLGHDDELDVRERAKSALWQIKHGY